MAFSSALPGLGQAEVERQLGFALSPEQATELSRLVLERSRKLRVEPSSYVHGLNAGEREDEALTLAGHFTVGESYFCRDWAQLNLCCELIVERLRDQRRHRPIKVLSAGCSTGEEPYSLLMLLHSHVSSTEGLEVSAIDINRAALEKARLGRYSGWSLRETPEAMRERWFRRHGSAYQLSSEITRRVAFSCASLNMPSHALARHSYDVILCRNVLMYFTADKYHEAAQRLIDALVPSGHLLLGHAESLRGMGLSVSLVDLADSFCYRKSAPPRRGDDKTSPRRSQVSPVDLDSLPTPLTSSAAHREPAPTPLPATLPTSSSSPLIEELAGLTHIQSLLESERFVEALGALETSSVATSPTQQLCLAVLLVYTNRFEAALAKATTLLNVDGVSAEAHYTLALCHEHAGDWARAMEFARRATYLDPTFAMPWLHLGILSRKRGDRLAARRELLQARALLDVEPTERLLWFGGGCSRGTLLAACQRELASTGGAA